MFVLGLYLKKKNKQNKQLVFSRRAEETLTKALAFDAVCRLLKFSKFSAGKKNQSVAKVQQALWGKKNSTTPPPSPAPSQS